MRELPERFISLVRRLGGSGDARPEADALLAAWAEPARVYHGSAHLIDCLAQVDELPEASGGAGGVDPVEAALWYHDAVYDSRAGDNEERSAAWAKRALVELGVAPRLAAEVARLVRLTGHAEPATDEAGRLVCDIDLSVLGRPPAEFDTYDAAIRAEYAWVPEEAFREGRRRVLRALLARAPLYGTERFRRRYEEPARANLRRALARLGESA
jgi:predicted metal-dependent HD superfamily phosphohydrolase